MNPLTRLAEALLLRRLRAGPLSTEHVLWGYRLFLDREAESLDVVRGKVENQPDTRALRHDFMSSFEFRANNPEIGYITDRNIVIKELEGGLRLFIDLADHFIGLSVARGDYEVQETRYTRSIVKPGQTVLDIGANIGYFSILLGSLVGPSGRVYAFEPLTSNLDLLRRSVEENHQSDRIVVTEAAVGLTAGTADLVVPTFSMNSGGSYLDAGGGDKPPGHATHRVPVVAIDEQDIRRPVSFIKIDVEGAELLALRGAKKTLERDRPTILCEINTRQLGLVSRTTPAQLIVEIEALGYSTWQLRDAELVRDEEPPDRPGVRSIVFLPR